MAHVLIENFPFIWKLDPSHKPRDIKFDRKEGLKPVQFV